MPHDDRTHSLCPVGARHHDVASKPQQPGVVSRMWAFWLVLGAVFGRLTSVEARRLLRWRVTKWVNGDPNGDAVNEYLNEQRKAS